MNDKKPMRYDKEYYAQTFELYKMWKSLPPILRHSSDDELRQAGLAGYKLKTGLAETDDVYQIDKLIDIRTQLEFCEKYDVSKDTLTKWNKRLHKEGYKQLDYIGIWSKKLIPNIMMSMYRHITLKGSPELVRFMFQLAEGYDFKDNPPAQVTVNNNPLATMTKEELEELENDFLKLIEEKRHKKNITDGVDGTE